MICEDASRGLGRLHFLRSSNICIDMASTYIPSSLLLCWQPYLSLYQTSYTPPFHYTYLSYSRSRSNCLLMSSALFLMVYNVEVSIFRFYNLVYLRERYGKIVPNTVTAWSVWSTVALPFLANAMRYARIIRLRIESDNLRLIVFVF